MVLLPLWLDLQAEPEYLVPSGINVLWTGAHADIPVGWTRNTSLDAKYVIGAAVSIDGGGTGGQATHIHTVVDHAHNTTSHSHAVIPLNGQDSRDIDENVGFSSFDSVSHNHGVSNTDNEVVRSNDATGVTMDAQNNDPPYVKVIYIESDGTPAGVADDATTFWEDGTPPTGWNENDGGGTRTDLRNKFLRGADAAGDSGGTGGTSNSHTHTEDGTKHTHTIDSHTHGGSGVSALSDKNGFGGGGGGSNSMSVRRHTHNYTLGIQSSTMSLINLVDTTKIGSVAADATPPYQQLKAIQNENGTVDLPDGVITMWFGTRASVPLGWAEVTSMRENFVRAATASGSGGSAAHTHTGIIHNHDVNGSSHNHTATGGAANQQQGSEVIVATEVATTHTHTHTWIVGSSAPTSSGNTVTLNNNTSETNYPAYVKAVFLKFDSALLEDVRSVHTMAIGMGMSRL